MELRSDMCSPVVGQLSAAVRVSTSAPKRGKQPCSDQGRFKVRNAGKQKTKEVTRSLLGDS